MNKQWQIYNDTFLKLTSREQYLIFLTGLIAVFFIVFYLFIDTKIIENKRMTQQIKQLESSNETLQLSTLETQAALQGDPNEEIQVRIAQYEAKLAKIDEQLLTLTSDLISPVQMRHALLELLKVKKGVSLISFELSGAQPLLENTVSTDNGANEVNEGLNLYRHGIKIKLSGSYFDLRDYLSQLEKLSWKFFWQDFNFKLTEYPKNELEIEMYSLGTKKEFIGV